MSLASASSAPTTAGVGARAGQQRRECDPLQARSDGDATVHPQAHGAEIFLEGPSQYPS
jgi:hypothetical protein